jgi:hypothetical protein
MYDECDRIAVSVFRLVLRCGGGEDGSATVTRPAGKWRERARGGGKAVETGGSAPHSTGGTAPRATGPRKRAGLKVISCRSRDCPGIDRKKK